MVRVRDTVPVSVCGAKYSSGSYVAGYHTHWKHTWANQFPRLQYFILDNSSGSKLGCNFHFYPHHEKRLETQKKP